MLRLVFYPLSLSHLSTVNACHARFCKNKLLGPNIARYGFWMRLKLYIYREIISVVYFMKKDNIGHATPNVLCSHPSWWILVTQSIPVLAQRKNERLGRKLAGYVSQTLRK